jgi:cytochrome d ubiquinol oxidase subunit I
LLQVLLPLPWIANFTGWMVTEMGRQPFMVYGLLTVDEGVSANTVGEVLAGLIGLWVVYLGLIGLDIFLLTRTARAGLHRPGAEIPSAPAPDYAELGRDGFDAAGAGSDASPDSRPGAGPGRRDSGS